MNLKPVEMNFFSKLLGKKNRLVKAGKLPGVFFHPNRDRYVQRAAECDKAAFQLRCKSVFMINLLY